MNILLMGSRQTGKLAEFEKFAATAKNGVQVSVVPLPEPLDLGEETAGVVLFDDGKLSAASWIARHTRSGVAGMSIWRIPYSDNASTSAFITEGSAPAQPASPQPFAPRTLVFAGTGWKACVNSGASSARGSA